MNTQVQEMFRDFNFNIFGTHDKRAKSLMMIADLGELDDAIDRGNKILAKKIVDYAEENAKGDISKRNTIIKNMIPVTGGEFIKLAINEYITAKYSPSS